MPRRLSTSGIYRLALYNRHLSNLNLEEHEYISSQELAKATGHTAAQVRKDLTSYGSIGEPGKGYEIGKLRAMLSEIFGKEKVRKIALVGVGNLGLALIAHRGFRAQNFRIVAAFDRDVRKIGKYVEDVFVHDIRDLNEVLARMNVNMAIVSVPAISAQRVVDQLIAAGVKGILNFATTHIINAPKDVKLQNVDMSIELDRLYYLLKSPE